MKRAILLLSLASLSCAAPVTEESVCGPELEGVELILTEGLDSGQVIRCERFPEDPSGWAWVIQ